MNYLVLRNWGEFQHYKDRNPPWIKFHNSILDDYIFCKMPDAHKWHIVASFLLASRTENRIPADSAWISAKIGATSKVSIDDLLASGMFELIQDDSGASVSVEHDASKVLVSEEKRREENINTLDQGFSDFWGIVPNKHGSKSKAQEKFRQIAKSISVATLLSHARTWRSMADAENGSYTPHRNLHATTWLTQRRWESYGDTVAPTAPARPQVANMHDGLKLTFDDA